MARTKKAGRLRASASKSTVVVENQDKRKGKKGKSNPENFNTTTKQKNKKKDKVTTQKKSRKAKHGFGSNTVDSLFGPISFSRGPTMTTRNILAPRQTAGKPKKMETRKASISKASKKSFSKGKTSTSGSNKNTSAPRKWVLSMPIVSQYQGKPVAWHTQKPKKGSAVIECGDKSNANDEKKGSTQSSIVARRSLFAASRGNGEDDHPAALKKVVRKQFSFPVASLDYLREELIEFANYVRLDSNEIQARRNFIRRVENICCQLFGVSADQCQVFGSFSVLPVCTFESDVDIALHGVVSPQELDSKRGYEGNANDDTDEEEASNDDQSMGADIEDESEDSVVALDQDGDNENDGDVVRKQEETKEHPNRRRQEKVQRWKEALAEMDDLQKGQQGCVEMKELPKAFKVVPNIQERKEESQAKESTDKVKLDNAINLEDKEGFHGEEEDAREKIESAKPGKETESVEYSENGTPLFVIDREGFVDEDDNEENDNDDSKLAKNCDAPGNVNDAASITPQEQPIVTDDTTSNTTSNASSSSNANCGDEYSSSKESNDGDSDADSADKLNGLRRREAMKSENSSVIDLTLSEEEKGKQEYIAQNVCDDEEDEYEEVEEGIELKQRARSRSVISLCSATTCSENDDKAWDDSGMEVSFVSSTSKPLTSNRNQRSTKAAFGPTGETRVLVVRALNSVAKRLRRMGLTRQVHVRKWARVPIINMETHYGYECDIAIGGHNGTDTSDYARYQSSRFTSFSSVVLLLKVLLSQHGLDKPFTGGLGSYKLYVLVAHHIEQHLALGGEDNPADILLMFLYRYGNIVNDQSSSADIRLQTFLSPEAVVRSRGDPRQGNRTGEADMGGVRQVGNCVRVFQACYARLRQKILHVKFNPSNSMLGHIVDARSLNTSREDCRRKIPKAPSSSPVAGRKRDLSFIASGKKQFSDIPVQHEFAALNTDEEAEELAAAYGFNNDAKKKRSILSKKGSSQRARKRSKKSKRRRSI